MERTMKRNREAGQALYLTAAALVVLVGFMGLGIDMGMLRYEKRIQQTAADAAAVAGAMEMPVSGSFTSAGQEASAHNGFADNAGGSISSCTAPGAAVGTICVQINNPPQSGPHASCASPCNYVEALVSEVHSTYFMRIFGRNSATVTARAVATIVSSNGNTPPGCIYTLGPQGTGVGVTNSGTPTVNAQSCGIYDNGDWTTNGATVNINAGSIGTTDTTPVNHGGGTVTCGGSTANCPTPGIPPVTDPLAGLPAPSVGSPVTWNKNNAVPGTYGGMTINSTDTVNFAPGMYVIDGGTLKINAGATVCNQTTSGCTSPAVLSNSPPSYGPIPNPNDGVTFYLTNGASVQVNGLANVWLSAPNSGTYAGILFYQDPSDCQAGTLNGTSSSAYQGALYFPGNPNGGCNVQLNFGGTMTNTSSAYTVIVTDDLKIFGTSDVTINSDFSSLPGGTFRANNAVLVE